LAAVYRKNLDWSSGCLWGQLGNYYSIKVKLLLQYMSSSTHSWKSWSHS